MWRQILCITILPYHTMPMLDTEWLPIISHRLISEAVACSPRGSYSIDNDPLQLVSHSSLIPALLLCSITCCTFENSTLKPSGPVVAHDFPSEVKKPRPRLRPRQHWPRCCACARCMVWAQRSARLYKG